MLSPTTSDAASISLASCKTTGTAQGQRVALVKARWLHSLCEFGSSQSVRTRVHPLSLRAPPITFANHFFATRDGTAPDTAASIAMFGNRCAQIAQFLKRPRVNMKKNIEDRGSNITKSESGVEAAQVLIAKLNSKLKRDDAARTPRGRRADAARTPRGTPLQMIATANGVEKWGPWPKMVQFISGVVRRARAAQERCRDRDIRQNLSWLSVCFHAAAFTFSASLGRVPALVWLAIWLSSVYVDFIAVYLRLSLHLCFLFHGRVWVNAGGGSKRRWHMIRCWPWVCATLTVTHRHSHSLPLLKAKALVRHQNNSLPHLCSFTAKPSGHPRLRSSRWPRVLEQGKDRTCPDHRSFSILASLCLHSTVEVMHTLSFFLFTSPLQGRAPLRDNSSIRLGGYWGYRFSSHFVGMTRQTESNCVRITIFDTWWRVRGVWLTQCAHARLRVRWPVWEQHVKKSMPTLVPSLLSQWALHSATREIIFSTWASQASKSAAHLESTSSSRKALNMKPVTHWQNHQRRDDEFNTFSLEPGVNRSDLVTVGSASGLSKRSLRCFQDSWYGESAKLVAQANCSIFGAQTG